jgi:hypothetical protein
MSFRPIAAPLSGEHVLAVTPRPTFPSVDASWRRRTRLFPGRALDDRALTREQDARGGQLALLGQTLAPGVVVGLDVLLETSGFSVDEAPRHLLRVAPGIGLLASGEDVVLGRELRVQPSALAPGGLPPLAGILSLQPVIRWVRGRFDPDDQCLRDETEDAFADEQRVDGVRLVLTPWDPAWAPLTEATATRNQLAYLIFEMERLLDAGELAPWQVGGVPLALIGFGGGRITYVDRHAVVRTGGHAPPRSPLVPAELRAGHRPLWQARILQLIDHVGDAQPGGGSLPTAAAIGLGFLPPAGVVPAGALGFEPLTNRFFPPAWRLRCAPIPREQVDGVIAHAAGMAPLSTSTSEEVLVLVPVPQAVYEPELLVLDSRPDPIFETEIGRLAGERSEWLGRRAYLRTRRDAIVAAIDRRRLVADPSPDPDALENEGTVSAISAGEGDLELVDVGGVLRPRAVVDLKTRLDAPMAGSTSALLSDEERALLFGQGLVPLIAALDAKLKRADDTIDFGFLRAQTDIYRLRQYVLGNTLATRLAVSPALASIAKGETSAAVRDDLARLTGVLKGPPVADRIAPSDSAPAPRASSVIGTAVRAGVTRTTTFEAARRLAVLEREPAADIELGPAGLRRPAGLRVPAEPRAPAPREPERATVDSVHESGAVIGGAEFRTVSVAERLAPAVSTEIRNAAKATNQATADSLIALHGLGLNIGDLKINGAAPTTGRGRGSFTIKDALADSGRLGTLLGDPPADTHDDESVYFNDAATVLEGHIVTLRNLEGRVAQYRAVLNDCRQVLAHVSQLDSAVESRLAEVQHELTERRHAIATARALLADEVARLARITARRRAVLAQHVEMIAYARPRFFDGLLAVPQLPLDPGLIDSPLPACLSGHADAPDAIDQLLLLLREAPLSWLRYARAVLDPLDRIELLHGLVLTARNRVQAMAVNGFDAPWAVQPPAGRFGPILAKVARAQVDAVWQPRAAIAQLDVRRFVGLSWQESREAASHVVSLGDVIEGSHGRSAAAQAALAELDRIGKVSACLWARVGDVEPTIRLAWAEALSQYEAGAGLRKLSALPRWRDVDFRLRNDLEVLSEWLVDRADPTRVEAVGWMLDLVRTAILLASHAPVDEIIAGHVPTPAPAHPGALVPVAIDPRRIRIGMHVTFFHDNAAVARAVVEDLVGDRARARIAEAVRDDLRLDAGVRAHFTARPQILLRGR